MMPAAALANATTIRNKTSRLRAQTQEHFWYTEGDNLI